MDNQNEPQIVPPPSTETVRAEDIVNTPQAEPAVTGEIVEEKPGKGRPSGCNADVLQKAYEYFDLCSGKTDGRKRFPYLEELALLLDVDEDTITNWAKDNKDFFGAVKKLKNLQKFSLMHRGFSMRNPAFAIFLLKANHGMMETEKRIMEGGTVPIPISEFVKQVLKPQDVPHNNSDEKAGDIQ